MQVCICSAQERDPEHPQKESFWGSNSMNNPSFFRNFDFLADAEEEADLQSRLKEFVWRVIDEVCPTALDTNPSQIDSCRLELIGHRITSTGKQEGMKSTIQERCTQCRINGRREKNSGRAIRTSFRCALHRDVYLCNASKGPCLQEHMEEHGCV